MNRDQILKEARSTEAIKKGYMGLEGKFSSITKGLGQPIIRQGGLYHDCTYLEDPYAEFDEFEIPTMDENEESFEIGFSFDGLSRGMNLTISIIFHLREITVFYEGKVVYKEIAGELEGFCPSEDWEEKIENLYSICKKIERKNKPAEKKRLDELAEMRKKEILKELNSRWGL